MWAKISAFIIRNRLAFLLIILGITAFMGYKAKDVRVSYDYPQVIPESDDDYIYYQKFKQQFGEDGDMLILGFRDKDVFDVDIYNRFYRLGEELRKIEGVKSVASVTNLFTLEKNSAARKFNLIPLATGPLRSQAEADSIHDAVTNLPFYQNLFYNEKSHATLMAVKLEKETLLSEARVKLIDQVRELATQFSEDARVKMHYTGVPYIRTVFAHKIQQELNLFLILSVIITSIILFYFFRSFSFVIFPLVIIGVIIVWTMGIVEMLGYKLTMLTGLIPPLIVIIAVPNFIYFLNRYHTEYKKYGNKMRGIIMMVKNIAKVVFLNNVTTAIGFGVLYFIDSPILKEFGVVAFLMITSTYFLSLILMPLVLSFMPEPSARHTNYLNNRFMNRFIRWIDTTVQHKRKLIYTFSIAIGIASAIGAYELRAIGYMMDDIPKNDALYTDLLFFEKNFDGVMPFEVVVDTKRERGLLDINTLAKVEQLQDSIEALPAFSNALSAVDVAKFARQAFYNGSAARYELPSRREQMFLLPYLRGADFGENSSAGNTLTDSSYSMTRISARMADIGSVEMEKTLDKLDRDAREIFGLEPKLVEEPKSFAGKVRHYFTSLFETTHADTAQLEAPIEYRFTGFSKVFLKGNSYLVENLVTTLIMAVLLIIVVIAFMFRSARLVIITLIPNCLALLITAGVMGAFGIPLKPSTILVFSIAFGIAVDASFHFLVTYRQDLYMHNWNISKTITISLQQTGFSIIYTSLVLFFGFGIFAFSRFGSTVSLGLLTSLAVLVAMFTNIILIPALLLSFDKKTKRDKRKFEATGL